MIEATLDRTLVDDDLVQREEIHSKVQAVLDELTTPATFHQFIAEMMGKTGLDQKSAENAFWELLDNGDIHLSSTFEVKTAGIIFSRAGPGADYSKCRTRSWS